MQRLTPRLKQDNVEPDLILLIRTILAASKEIAFRVSQGALSGVLGSTLDENIQGEVQKKLDVVANQLLKDMLCEDTSVRAIASEEEEFVVLAHEHGAYIVAFDPLDGSSNIDINGQIGTIFTIYRARDDVPADSAQQFAQLGEQQLCAGYVLYGPSTFLMMSTGGPTRGYTLDLTHGGYLLTHPEIKIPEASLAFGVNFANYRFWQERTQQYFDQVLYASDDYKSVAMRYNGAMVGDINRMLLSGGVFHYPSDTRVGHENGKIRLLYEANPMAFLVEKAGGEATANGERILSMPPKNLHQRVPVTMGCRLLVNEYNRFCHS